MLDSRPKGRGFEPHRRHYAVVLEKTHIYPSLVLVQPRNTHPCLTERFLMGSKESNLTNKQTGTWHNSKDPGEMQHGAKFHPVLHCILTHISLASFLWVIDKHCRPRSDATERGVRSGSQLFTYNLFYQILNKNEKIHLRPLNRKWTGPIDKGGKFH